MGLSYSLRFIQLLRLSFIDGRVWRVSSLTAASADSVSGRCWWPRSYCGQLLCCLVVLLSVLVALPSPIDPVVIECVFVYHMNNA